MQQRHDDNLSDAMHRYFAKQLSIIDREGNTISICHTIHQFLRLFVVAASATSMHTCAAITAM